MERGKWEARSPVPESNSGNFLDRRWWEVSYVLLRFPCPGGRGQESRVRGWDVAICASSFSSRSANAFLARAIARSGVCGNFADRRCWDVSEELLRFPCPWWRVRSWRLGVVAWRSRSFCLDLLLSE
jgi:hypothetical protein